MLKTFSSGKRKITFVRNLDLYKGEKRSLREEIKTI